MTDDLMREFGVSATALGNLAAVYMYAYAALQIPAGIAFDRWGPRATLAGAAACCAAGAVLFGLAPSIEAAMFGRLLIGAGSTGWMPRAAPRSSCLASPSARPSPAGCPIGCVGARRFWWASTGSRSWPGCP